MPLECELVVSSQWNSGFTADVTLTNVSDTVIEGWQISLEFLDGGSLNNLWNGEITANTGDLVQVKNLSWNQRIQPGQSVQLGFVASQNGGTGAVSLTGDLCR